MNDKLPLDKLALSILIDLIGCFSYLIPGFGEVFDVVWAPVSFFIMQEMYGSLSLSILSAVEEILPGTDFIPTATIGFISQHTNLIPLLSKFFQRSQQTSSRNNFKYS